MVDDVLELIAAAEGATTLAAADPQRARTEAESLLAATADPRVVVTAERALGLALREIGETADATRRLRRALRVATRFGLREHEGKARMSLALMLAERGRTDPALAEIDRAATLLDGADHSRVLAQRGLLLQRVRRDDEALDCYRRALPALRRESDAPWLARVLLNRGTLHAYRGEHRAAEADLKQCVEISSEAGLLMYQAFATHDLGFAYARRGDVPAALALFDEARPALTHLGLDRAVAVVLMDRAGALVSVGIGAEAKDALDSVVRRLAHHGSAYDLAEARLAHARAALLEGDLTAAQDSAARAHAEFRRQRRGPWAALAYHVETTVRFARGDRTAGLLATAVRSSERLDAASWPEEAAEGRLIAGRVALSLGRTRVAGELLSAVAGARHRNAAETRATAWHAEALHRLMRGDRQGARSALRAGLRVLEDNAAILGATDLRCHAAVLGQDIAIQGLRLALEDHQARGVLEWSERWRAGALRYRPVRPPQDAQLARDLAALRGVVAEINEAGLAGRDTGRLRAEQVRLEQAVRDRSRHARRATGSREYPDRFTVEGLVAALGDRALVELVHLDGQLHAVTVVDGRVRLRELGSYTEALREMESLRFSLNVLARRSARPGDPTLLEVTRDTMRHAAGRLDALLLSPLRPETGDRELVVVPTLALHALPWPALPTCGGRPVTVAPSARTWQAAAERSIRDPGARGSGSMVLVSGPRLTHAQPEIEALAARYPTAVRLTGDSATAAAVSAALDGAALAHIAAHGHFRADNPLFSALELADGPLTVYDLERLGGAPRRLVLSACDSALSAVRPGDELMGLASAVFALGTSTLVASVTPVPDDETRVLMLDLHERLARGVPPARALAEAGEATQVDGFVCFGAG